MPVVDAKLHQIDILHVVAEFFYFFHVIFHGRLMVVGDSFLPKIGEILRQLCEGFDFLG